MVVEFCHDHFQFSMGDRIWFAVFLNILADQSIHGFIRTTLPGSLRIREKDVAAMFMINAFVFSEHFTIFPSDVMYTICTGLEEIDHGVADRS